MNFLTKSGFSVLSITSVLPNWKRRAKMKETLRKQSGENSRVRPFLVSTAFLNHSRSPPCIQRIYKMSLCLRATLWRFLRANKRGFSRRSRSCGGSCKRPHHLQPVPLEKHQGRLWLREIMYSYGVMNAEQLKHPVNGDQAGQRLTFNFAC